MTLAFQNGGLIFSGGGLGQHPACCCKPPPPPGSARCDCSLFFTCTTTVEYDGRVVSFNSAENTFAGGTREAGTESYVRFGFPQTQINPTAFREFFAVQCNLSALQETFSNSLFAQISFGKLCDATATYSVSHHLVVVTRAVAVRSDWRPNDPFPFPAQAYLYKYSLDQPPTAPCPGSLSGRTVTAQQVASYDNKCESTGCGEVLADAEAYDGGGFVFFKPASIKYDFSWDNNIVGFFDSKGDLCQVPIWGQQPGPPSVSIACAP